MFFQVAYQVTSQFADRSESTIYKPTMLPNLQVLPLYQPGNLETYEPTSLEKQSSAAWWPLKGPADIL